MVTINEALELINAGFSVEDIRAMDSKPKEEQKPEQKPKEEQKPEQKPNEFDARLEKLTGVVENLVETVGKLPFSFSMGDNGGASTDSILASIINPHEEKKGDK